MTVNLRHRTDGKGHLLLQVDGDDAEGVGPRFVSVHRLAAVAWGKLDGLDDHYEVHHVDTVPCHNAERNLLAVDSELHGKLTRANEQARRAD